MIFIFEYGYGCARFTVESDSLDSARKKVSDYLRQRVRDERDSHDDYDSMHWLSEDDYDRWLKDDYSVIIVKDTVHVNYM